MEDQLPTPIGELILLNLYLNSITLLLGVLLVALVIYRNGKFNWTKFIVISILLFVFGTIGSMLIWANWNTMIDIMLGPFHLPTLISITIIGIALLKLFGLKIVKKPVPNIGS